MTECTSDAYISYRRRGGGPLTTLLLSEELLGLGLRVFHDAQGSDVTVGGMRAGMACSTLLVQYLEAGSLAQSCNLRLELRNARELQKSMVLLATPSFDLEKELLACAAPAPAPPAAPHHGGVAALTAEEVAYVRGAARVAAAPGAGRAVAAACDAAVAAAPAVQAERSARAAARATHRLQGQRAMRQLHGHADLLLVAPPSGALHVDYLHCALRQRCPELRVSVLQAGAGEEAARSAVAGSGVAVFVMSAAAFEGACAPVGTAFAAACALAQQQQQQQWSLARLCMLAEAGRAEEAQSLGEGPAQGWAQHVPIEPFTWVHGCSQRSAVLGGLLAQLGARPAAEVTPDYPCTGVTMAGIRRFFGGLFGEHGCEALMGSEVYARTLDKLRGMREFSHLVRTDRPLVTIAGLFSAAELGGQGAESNVIATYHWRQPFSHTLDLLDTCTRSGDLVFLDVLCLPAYKHVSTAAAGSTSSGSSASSGGAGAGTTSLAQQEHPWVTHVARHERLCTSFAWGPEEPCALFSLRRAWKIAEIAVASVKGVALDFQGVFARECTARSNAELLAEDYEGTWRHRLQDWQFSTAYFTNAKDCAMLTGIMKALFGGEGGGVVATAEAAPAATASRVQALDLAIKNRVTGELHAWLCGELRSACEGQGVDFATSRLPLTLARLLLEPGIVSGRAMAPYVREAAWAEAAGLCQRVLAARLARGLGAQGAAVWGPRVLQARLWLGVAEAASMTSVSSSSSSSTISAAPAAGRKRGRSEESSATAAEDAAEGSGTSTRSSCRGSSSAASVTTWEALAATLPPPFNLHCAPNSSLVWPGHDAAAIEAWFEGGSGATGRGGAAATASPPSAGAWGAPPPHTHTAASAAAPAAAASHSVLGKKAAYMGMLAEDLRAGRVVLFLGAGIFKPAALPDWKELMIGLVGSCGGLGEGVRESLLRSVGEGGSANYEMVAQILEDKIGVGPYEKTLREQLSYDPIRHESAMKQTFALLRLLPFRAILTTNFTRAFSADASAPPTDFSIVPGDPGIAPAQLPTFLALHPPHLAVTAAASLAEAPGRDTMLLRCAGDAQGSPACPQPALQARYDAPCLHIHGASKAVSTRKSYRDLLYSTQTLPLLRALCTSARFLFLGYSLSDAYLQELLQETLSLLLPRGGAGAGAGVGVGAGAADPTRLGYVLKFKGAEEPLGAALEGEMDYKLRHLGLCIIPTAHPVAELQALVHGASRQQQLARAFWGARLVCVERARAGAGGGGFEALALALAELALAAVPPGAAEAEAELAHYRAREREFRCAQDDFCSAVAGHAALGLPPPTARPPQRLPLPRGGEVLVCYSAAQAMAAVAGGGGAVGCAASGVGAGGGGGGGGWRGGGQRWRARARRGSSAPPGLSSSARSARAAA